MNAPGKSSSGPIITGKRMMRFPARRPPARARAINRRARLIALLELQETQRARGHDVGRVALTFRVLVCSIFYSFSFDRSRNLNSNRSDEWPIPSLDETAAIGGEITRENGEKGAE
ncbi:hypothetical protein X777_03977 [Ooceraea biroi]|uniref:Uncharacterized protein n=1 Tax=Ooceraea biroi TaxID=2015173 RepID=A0A026WIC6_OOCBI|nr:hypothetical protein X777_03977 [Ooceraea biroi]